METSYRNKLIKIVTFLGGIYFFLEFILPQNVIKVTGFDKYNQQITDGFSTVMNMAIGLGLIKLFNIHGSRIIFRRKGFSNSIALLCGLFLMTYVTLANWMDGERAVSSSNQISVLAEFTARIKSDAESVDSSDPYKKKDTVSNLPPLATRNEALLKATQELSLDEILRPLDKVTLNADQAKLVHAIEDDIRNAYLAVQSTTDEMRQAGLQDLSRHDKLATQISELSVLRRSLLEQYAASSFNKGIYNLLFDGLFTSLGSAVFALLGFYIAVAAYRAFRIRSFESGLMMAAALLVMLGQIPFGVEIYQGMPDIRQWLLEVPNSAAFRAIKICIAIAGLGMAYRMWFSIESESFVKK